MVNVIELIDANGNEGEFWQWCNKKQLSPEDVLHILRTVKVVEFVPVSRLFTVSTEELVKELQERNYNG